MEYFIQASFNPRCIALFTLLVDTANFNVYDDGTNNFFETTETTIWSPTVTSPIRIRYNSVDDQWEMVYYNSTLGFDVVVGVLPDTTSLCPTSLCDWETDCVSFIFQPRLTAHQITWTGEYLNGRKKYSKYFNDPGLGGAFTWTFYWDGVSRWVIERDPGTALNWAYSTVNSQCIPTNITWYSTFDNTPTLYQTFPLGVLGYYVKIYENECGCCDDILNVSFKFGATNYSVTASIAVDEFGNTLGYNSYPYYSFSITYLGSPMTFYLFFNGEYWGVSQAISESPLYYTSLRSDNECPFGPYVSGGLFDRFSVTGSECFDCCDYYTPRFSNFIKKKKYELVEDIDAIRSKEIFGFKCGPEWSTLFKHHLILDVLHCLPYGVLCEEEEQCLMNNLSENCNC